MKNYSIVRIGNEYVVQAGEKSVLKISSRRKAARLVTDAAELLDSQAPAALAPPDEQCRAINPPVIPRVIPDPVRSSLTIQADSLMHRGGTPPPNGRLSYLEG